MSFLAACGLLSLGSCALSSICSIGRMCCCALGAASGGAHGASHAISTKASKAGFILIIAISALFALVLYAYGNQITWLQSISVINDICTNQGAIASQCFGASAVLRISLALTIFFGLMALTAFSADLFVGMWMAKVLLWLGLLVGCFFVPASAIEGYGQTARVLSILFVLAMVILLIDFAYHVQESLAERIDATNAALREAYDEIGCCQNLWRWLYLGLATLFIAGSFAGIVLMYSFSANRPNGVTCGQNIGFLSTTLVTGLVYLVLSPLQCLGGSRGILTPSVVLAYCTWLCWSAINAQPETACNPSPLDASNTGASIVGMLIAAASLCYTAFSASRSLPHMFDMSAKHQAAVAAGHHDGDEHGGGASEDSVPLAANAHGAGAATTGAAKSAGDAESGHAAAYTASSPAAAGAAAAAPAAVPPYSALDSGVFCAVLVLAAMYMAPVLTNWVTDPSDIVASRASPATMWVNIASQWATIALYCWTLVAPTVCSSRDFSG